MKTILLTAELISSVTMAIVLYASIRESTIHGRKDRVFSLFVGLNLFVLLTDAVSWFLDGHTDLVNINYVISYISTIGSYLLAISFGEYLKLHLTQSGGQVGALQKVNMVYGIVAMTVGTFACFSGQLFSFENGRFVEGRYYSYYLLSMIPMYALQFIMLIRNLKTTPVHDSVAFLCYSLMPVFMTGIGMLVPGLSLTLPGMAISVLLIFVTMQSGLHRAAAVREEALREKSYTDELTGAQNRRSFSERCLSLADTDYIKIAFCDVNGLKYINDTSGHAEGDNLLRRISNCFRESFGDDEFYRISGDEFVVLEVNTEPGVFENRLQKLQEAMQDMEYEPVSIGTAEGAGSEFPSLLNNAEEEMYAAKTLFHRRNPRFVRGGELFVQDILDDTNNIGSIDYSAFQSSDEIRLGRKSKILLVESSIEEMRLLKGLLSENYDVIDSNSSEQALEILKEISSSISLILVNVRLPEISGYKLLREIMNNSQLSTIPVILTSSNMKRAEETDYLRLGAYDCIHKPYSPDILLNRIRRAVELKESLNVLADVEFDELTGVYTRQAFFHYMRNCLLDSSETAYDLTILDVPDFKSINKRFNEEIGDQVLKHIAAQIREFMHDRGGRYGRYGSDIFMIFTTHGKFGEAQREALAAKIENDPPVEGLTVKFGVYENLPSDVVPSVLCDLTMTALRSIKHVYGIRTGSFNSGIQQSIDRTRRLETDMETAIQEKQFKVYYQPKHDAKTGRLTGAEALVRWVHPQLGMLYPSEFIPQFERNGFIHFVDQYVWRRTCDNLKRWTEEGLNPVPVSINASRRDFSEPEYFEEANSERERAGIPAKMLHMEITESALAESSDMVKKILQQCRDNGYLIELDDFGTGYSALSELGTLPVDIVKMDKTFVINAVDPRGISVLNAGISLAKQLGLKVLVEGIETEEQLSMIRATDCDYIQGFCFAKPLCAEDFAEYLKNNRAR